MCRVNQEQEKEEIGHEAHEDHKTKDSTVPGIKHMVDTLLEVNYWPGKAFWTEILLWKERPSYHTLWAPSAPSMPSIQLYGKGNYLFKMITAARQLVDQCKTVNNYPFKRVIQISVARIHINIIHTDVYSVVVLFFWKYELCAQ